MPSLARYTPPPDTRPRPINDAANHYVRWLGVTGSLIVAAVGYGLVSIEQGDALQGLLGAIPGVMTAITTVLTAFGIVRRAEPEVTPLSSPRARDGSLMTRQSMIGADGHATVHHTSGRALATPHDEQFRTVSWWDSEGTDGTDVSDEFEDTDRDDREYASEPGPDLELQLGEANLTFSGHVVPRTDTAPSGPDTGRSSYAPPDTYPVADTAASGHHSPSNHDTGTSSGGGSDPGTSSTDTGGW